MIDGCAISEYTIDEIDHLDPTNYIELLELSKEHPNVLLFLWNELKKMITGVGD